MDEKRLIKLTRQYNLKYLVLFGSRARGEHKKSSDWDLAFLPKKRLTSKREMNLYNKISDILNTDKLDLVNLSKTNNLELMYRISLEGTLINKKEEGDFMAWKADVWFEYLDFQFIVNDRTSIVRKRLERLSGNG